MDARTNPAARRAEIASQVLLNRDPLASAAEPSGRARRTLLIAAPILALALIGAPQTTLVLSTLAMSALFLAAVAVRVFACLLPPWTSPLAGPDLRLPTITLLCPLYREAGQVEPLLDALERLDYPRARLETLLVVEADDPETVLAARRAARRRIGVKLVEVGPAGPRTKPKALAVALPDAAGELIAVYDAEDAPARGQLRAAARAFAADPALAVVQAPLGWYNANDSWLTRQFALEYAAQFHVLLPALARWGWALPLGGTSNVFRADALRASGGWDPWNVTEDADIGYRLARLGWRSGVIAPGTLEECPVTIEAWLAQRTRWLKGHLVTLRVHARRPRALLRGGGPGAPASLLLFLGANVLSAAVHPPAALATLAFALGGNALFHTPIWASAAACGALTLGYASALASGVVGARRAGAPIRMLDLATLPGYWALHAAASVRAVCEQGRRRAFWAKTRHGLTTTPRRAPDASAADTETDPVDAHDDDFIDDSVRVRAGVRRLAPQPPGRAPEGSAPDPVDGNRTRRGGGVRGARGASPELVRDRNRS